MSVDLETVKRLHEAGSRLIRQGDPGTLFRDVLDAAIDISRSEFGLLATFDPESHTFAIAAQQGYRQPFLEFFRTINSKRSLSELALEQGERLVLEDVKLSPALAGTETLKVLLDAGIRSETVTPLISHDGQLMGMLLMHWRDPHRPEEAVLYLLDLLAKLAADALQRALADKELRNSKERYRALFNRMDEGFCIIEVLFDGQERAVDYRVLEANPAYEKHTGLCNSKGKRMSELVPDLEEYWFERYGEIVRTGQPNHFEDHARPLGRWFDIYAFRIGKTGDRQVAILFNDITERKRREEAHRESEKRFRRLFHDSPLPAALLAPDFRFLEINRALSEFLMYSPEELAALKFPEFTYPDDLGADLANIKLLIEGKIDQYDMEKRFIRKDGVIVWGRLQVRAVRDEEGRLLYLMPVAQDITKQKRAEEALHNRAEELETLLESVPALVWIAHDPKGRHITGNRAADAFLRIPPKGEVSLTAPEGERPTHYRFMKDSRVLEGDELPLQRAARGNIVSGFEADIELDDGTVRTVVANATPLYDDEGRPRGAVSAFTDITERKRMENTLRESEMRFRSLFDQSPMGTSLVSPDFRFIMTNKAISDILGYTEKELASMTFADLTHPEDLEADVAQARRILEGKSDRYEMEKRLIRKDGAIIWGRLKVGGIRDDEGRLRYFLGMLEDITDRKKMEKALCSSLEEKDVLLRELSHRTKNNMQVIVGLLGMQATRSKDDRLTNAVGQAQDRIRAMALVHEKLYKSGNVSSLSIRDYAKDLATDLLKAHQGTRGPVKLELELEEIEVPYDAVLPGGMILNELMSNSLKHAFPDRKAGTIHISLRRRGNKIELRYRDDGPGLPGDMDPSKVDSLGLNLVHNLAVRQLRGTMVLCNDPLTEYVFRFPMPPAPTK